MVAVIGSRILDLVAFLTGVAGMIADSAIAAVVRGLYRPRPVMSVYLRQIYFTGIEALKVVIPLALLIGTVIVTQIISFAGLESRGLIGKLLVWVVIRELGPLLTAIIIIARSGTAIATELGNMKLNGEIDLLEGMGIPVSHYLIMPRIFGVATAVALLTVYFELVSITGGFLVAVAVWHVDFWQYTRDIVAAVTVRELVVSLVKSFGFGIFIAATCCWQGLGVTKSSTQIPQAATRGVMQSLFLVFIIDIIFTSLFLVI